MSEQEIVPDTMRAIYLPGGGARNDGPPPPPSPSSLLYTGTYPTAAPTSTQYLIQIHTTSPTPHELASSKSRPRIPSHEICGVVISTPTSDMNRHYPNGPKFKIGDEVFGLLSLGGGAADYTVAVEGELAFKPKNVTAAQAAVLPLAGLMAWQALEGAGLRSSLIEEAEAENGGGGEVEKGADFIRVLVLGAMSVVGRYVVQLLRANSAPFDGGIRRRRGRKRSGREDRKNIYWICATCSSGEDEAFLRDELGADAVVTLVNQEGDDTSSELSQIFKERKWPPVDVVLDCEEDNNSRSSSPDTAVSLATSPHIVRKDGGWEVLKLNLPEWSVEMVDVVDGSKKATESTKDGGKNKSWSFTVQPNGVQLAEIAEVVEKGEMKPIVEREFGLYEAKEAMEMVDRGVQGGKVVLRVNS